MRGDFCCLLGYVPCIHQFMHTLLSLSLALNPSTLLAGCQNLHRYYREGYRFRKTFGHVLGFRPTGWTHSQKMPALSFIRPKTRGVITVYGIPYSEHSSFNELKRCAAGGGGQNRVGSA